MATLSIIIPLHNKEAYIGEALRSVQTQDFPDWEAIVIENHSSDSGADVVRVIARSDDRVRLIEAGKSVRGPGAARNTGLSIARGDWIQFLDADDLILTGHFGRQWTAARASSCGDIITCDWLEGPGIDSSECVVKKPTNSRSTLDCSIASIAYTPWVVHAAWVKKSALGEFPWWDERFDSQMAEDHVFWFKILQTCQLQYNNHTGVYYRTESDHKRHDKKRMSVYLKGVDNVIQANLDLLEHRGIALNYEHRRVLFNSYLEQLVDSADAVLDQVRRRILVRIKEFRLPLLIALQRKNLAMVLSYFFPFRAIGLWQMRRRARAKSGGGTSNDN